jgi:PAS domain S-box-containing protein
MTLPRSEEAPAVPCSETRYRRLFESSHDGILILDFEDRTIMDANPFIEKLLGYAHHELIGKELWEIGLVRDREASQRAFQHLRETGHLRYEDLPLQTRGGRGARSSSSARSMKTANAASFSAAFGI